MDTQKSIYRQQFLLEVRDILDVVGDTVLKAESDPTNPELLNAIFRGVHTIKGSSAMFDLDSLGAFAHHLEGLLNSLRSGELTLSTDVVDIILKGLDALGEMRASIVRGEEPESRADLITCFGLVAGNVAAAVPGHCPDARPGNRHALEILTDQVAIDAARDGIAGTGQASSSLFSIELRYASDHLANGFDPAVFLRNLRSSCSFYRADSRDEVPECCNLRPLDLYLRPVVTVATTLSAEDIRELAFDASLVGVTEIEPPDGAVPESIASSVDQARTRLEPDTDGRVSGGFASQPDPADWSRSGQKPLGRILVEERKITEADLDHALAKQASGRPAEAGAPAELKVMRVDEAKIDGFTNMIGELVIAKNAYDFLVGKLDAGGGPDAAGLKGLKDNLRLFSRITGELQRGVMALRMVPIRGIFQKYSRVVRDISRKQKKFIDFKIEGGETEIDKKVADLLSEPLIHMIRNSCDHGIETPAARAAAGKRERGALTLRACREGSNLIVKISDDGCGIDRCRVYEKAVHLGIPVGSPEEENLLDVIFLPGFSMKDAVSDISGRGVGMDVVKSTLATLGGTVHVASTQGKGTTFTLDIPMSMGVSVALRVVAGAQQYALPIENVLETVKVSAGDVHDFGSSQGIHYRGEILPVARLEQLLDHKKALSGAARGFVGEEELPVVVLASAKGKYGLIIDQLLRNCEIAIKPVPDALAAIAFLGGVTILGDGRVLLVLNPEHLI